MRKKIEGHNHLVKDEFSKAVINTDKNAYALYKKRKTIMQVKNNEIEQLRTEMSELKLMMTQILDKCNGEECK